MKQEILKLDAISYAYEGQNALSDFSLCIGAGEKIAVLGNNGAGKSTFFLCCNGVLKPKQGSIYLNGKQIDFKQKSLTQLRQAVGLVFQEADHQLLAGTVAEEISFGPMNLDLPKAEVAARVAQAVEDMSLGDYTQRPPYSLSGGEKKRVTLADVLAMHPSLMLLDEPAASLDPQNAALLEENLGKLSSKGIGLVIATHDVDFAWRWAERILVMHKGELMADDVPEKIFCQEALLAKCGLIQPTLWQVGKALGIAPPRDMVALRNALSNQDGTLK